MISICFPCFDFNNVCDCDDSVLKGYKDHSTLRMDIICQACIQPEHEPPRIELVCVSLSVEYGRVGENPHGDCIGQVDFMSKKLVHFQYHKVQTVKAQNTVLYHQIRYSWQTCVTSMCMLVRRVYISI